VGHPGTLLFRLKVAIYATQQCERKLDILIPQSNALNTEGEESMTKKHYLLSTAIIFVCFMAIVSMSIADVVDSYGENTDDILSFLNDSKTGFIVAPFIEQAGETIDNPPQIIVMPISVGITVPFSITVNIFCTDSSCADLACSSVFDGAINLASQYSYTFESDGSEFEEYLSNFDFDQFLAILFDDMSDSEDIDMNAYNNFFDTSLISDLVSTTDVDIGTMSNQYVELYNKYYGKNAGTDK